MAQFKFPWKFNHRFKYNYARDTWFTQSCKCPTLHFALDPILLFMQGSFGCSTVLHMESIKILFPFPLPLQGSHSISLCRSKRNH